MVPPTFRTVLRGRLRLAPAFAFACAFAFLLTIALGAAPALHAALHSNNNDSAHACAVTLVQSGSCDSQTDSITCNVPEEIICSTVSAFIAPSIVLRGDFSPLEHAPPVVS
jgi:hypothetical protein